jgi:Spy/CpxP family protein refolding chaperone
MNTRLLFAAALVLATPVAYAQDTPQPAPAPSSQTAPAPHPHHDMGGNHDWGSKGGWNHGDHDRGMDRGRRPGHGWDKAGMHGRGDSMLPFGMWWKNPEVATRIGLSADQQKRIEDLFLQSRIQLIHMHASLEEEQLLLEPLLSANPFDEAKALDQINKIADTRADLEKANAKMLLNIRGVLTADQWVKLRSRDRGPHDPGGAWGDRGPEGPQGPPRAN